MGLNFTDNIALINAATASVTDPVAAMGTNVADVSKRQKMSLQFLASAISSGNGVFKVYVSNDGTNWVQYNRLVENITVADAHNASLVGSVTLSSNSNKIYFFSPGDHFRYLGVSLAVTTDGTYSAILEAAG